MKPLHIGAISRHVLWQHDRIFLSRQQEIFLPYCGNKTGHFGRNIWKKWSKCGETLANFWDVFATTRQHFQKRHRNPFQQFLWQHNWIFCTFFVLNKLDIFKIVVVVFVATEPGTLGQKIVTLAQQYPKEDSKCNKKILCWHFSCWLGWIYSNIVVVIISFVLDLVLD